jgi:hypothetical protein
MRLEYTDTKLEIQITDGARAGFYLTGWFNDGDCWWKKKFLFFIPENISRLFWGVLKIVRKRGTFCSAERIFD